MREPTFELIQQPFGKVAVLRDGLSNDALNYFKKNALKDKPSVSLSYVNSESLDFLLPHTDWIAHVLIHNSELMDWEVLNKLNNLVALKLDEGVNTKELDPSCFSTLKWLDCYWNKDIESKVPELTGLESILVRKYKSPDLDMISKLKNLVNLDISLSRTLQSIDVLPTLSKLEYVHLEKNSKLGDLSPLGDCKRLKSLVLDENKKAYSYESIAALGGLEELDMRADHVSVEWISNLTKLNKICLLGKIEDGDISFFKDMRKLKVVLHSGKRNFNLTEKDTDNLMMERGVDWHKLRKEVSKTIMFRSFPHPSLYT